MSPWVPCYLLCRYALAICLNSKWILKMEEIISHSCRLFFFSLSHIHVIYYLLMRSEHMDGHTRLKLSSVRVCEFKIVKLCSPCSQSPQRKIVEYSGYFITVLASALVWIVKRYLLKGYFRILAIRPFIYFPRVRWTCGYHFYISVSSMKEVKCSFVSQC
jgi:hypothetical protein